MSTKKKETGKQVLVKGVPDHIWRQLRMGALEQGMTFNDFMVKLLVRIANNGTKERPYDQ